ncbi:DUF1127 domain-containing protein [Marinomonas transparens]|uniref:DUF1127 domain-containing protein n=1 Tax=Marinomonas transparens TaxID=2795388 RepID=A0A934JS93_9GAMM|nr:DUF1127 domain-containing protein [Marinomonas transparens]MBJ7539773.1 DUF1127 domain-containing protein [Marinomonas transparens]
MTTHLSNHHDADLISQCCQRIEKKLTFKNVLAKLRKAYRNWRTRRQLMTISETDMKDLGLTRSDVYHEIEKPFWK